MAQASWPDPAEGRVVDERQLELLSARFSGDGVYWEPGNPAPVYADGTGLHVKVRAGLHGSMRGFGWASGDGDTLPIAPNTTGQTRADRVVLRLDRSSWLVRMAVRQGGASLPALVRQTGDTGVFETHAGVVFVPAGASTILAGDVVSYPVTPGSRVRPQHSSSRNPAPDLGEIAFDYDADRWVGWTGSRWRPVTDEPAESEASLSHAAKWPPSSGLNRVRRKGSRVQLDLNVTRAVDPWHDATPDGSPVATIPAGYRPDTNQWLAAPITPGNFARLRVLTNGEVWIDNSLGRVDPGRVLRVSHTYLI